MATLWLIGMMGTGKTTVGRLVAERAGLVFVDLDDDIESEVGLSISEIFSGQGETAFRALEAAAVETRAGADAVVACGGGVVLDERSRDRMRSSGFVVWLDAPAAVLSARLTGASDRPLLAGGVERRLEELTAARRHLYEEAADCRIEADADPGTVAERVEAAWKRS